MSARGRRIRAWAIALVLLTSAGGAAAGFYRMRKAQEAVNLPVAPAHKGEFLVIIRCRGEIKARRSVQVYAPVVPNLRIAWMVPPGERVKEGDPIIRFDSSSAQQELTQREAALRQAQASLDQAVAQAKITAHQDQSELADAKFNVEKARMEVDIAAVVSKIKGDQARVDLGVAHQKLKVQEATVALHEASDRSKIASITRQRDQAKADVEITKDRISQMELKAPIAGVLVFSMNYSQGWMNARQFKVGDNVFSGMGLVEIPDLESLEMDAKVEEIDRGRIEIGNDVRVRVDSLPELAMASKIRQISPLAETSFNEWPATRSFRAYSSIEKPDTRLRPGMNGGMDIIINRIPNATSIPSKALFTYNGKPVVYVARNGSYERVEVQVAARNPDEVAVTGIPDGAMVTLVDVAKDQKK